MPAGWVYLEHPDIDGGCQIPDDPSVIAAHEGRGWVVKPTPIELDPDAPNTGALPANPAAAVLAAQADDGAAAGGAEDPPPDPPGDTAAPPTKGPRAKTAGAPSTSTPSTTAPASADDQNKE